MSGWCFENEGAMDHHLRATGSVRRNWRCHCRSQSAVSLTALADPSANPTLMARLCRSMQNLAMSYSHCMGRTSLKSRLGAGRLLGVLLARSNGFPPYQAQSANNGTSVGEKRE